MKHLAIWNVAGDPKAQPRTKARAFTMRLGDGTTRTRARVYTPSSAKGWKRAVAEAGRVLCPATPLEGPVRVTLTFLMKRPQRLMRKKDPAGRVWHTAKPDFDNAAKAVADALTDAGWFRDDAILCDVRVLKQYHAKGEKPGAIIVVEEMEAD